MKINPVLGVPLSLWLLLAPCARVPAQEGAVVGGQAGEGAHTRGEGLMESPLLARSRALAASTADEALKWDDKLAAVRVVSEAADLLWGEDPARSRAWLSQAWELTGEVSEEDGRNQTRRYRNNSPRAGGRAAVLTVARRHDPKLADSLLEKLADEKEQSAFDSRRGVFDDRTARSEQLLNMALAVAESDPASAAGLAERSLADGVSFQLQSLLLALRARDVAAANRVFDAALARLATGHAQPSEGQVIASYLFTPGRVYGAGSGNTTALAVGARTPALDRTPAQADPARARRFLVIMQRVLLSMPAPVATANPSQSALEFVTLAGSLAGGFNLYATELWLPVAQRLTQVTADLKQPRSDERLPSNVGEKLRAAGEAGVSEKELNRLYTEGLEEAADKETNPVARKLAYAQAALATTPEELARGRRLADKIDEKELRERVVSFLVYRAALFELEKGRSDEAISLSAEAAPVQRAIVLITAAQRMTVGLNEVGEAQSLSRKLRALNLLYEAEKLLGRDDLPSDALRVRVGLVAALAPLDAVRALQAFNEVVKAINKLDSFDPAESSAPRSAGLDGFSAQSLLPRVRGGYGLKDALGPLARADFEATVAAAGKLTSPAARGTSMLEIAKTVLGSKGDEHVATRPTSGKDDSH